MLDYHILMEFFNLNRIIIRPNTSKLTRDWFARHDIELLDWSRSFPDMNPIENM